MNLKPEELVKALRCCAEGECSGCPMYADKQRCQEQTLASSADQIERDQKEMAELRAALEKATEMAGALNKKCDLMRDFGRTVFLTREEAENALAEMEGMKE